MSSGVNYDAELEKIDEEIEELEFNIRELEKRRRELVRKKERLTDRKNLKASEKLAEKDWERETFDWSDRLRATLNDVFEIDSFRPQQLSAINATLSKENAIVVMPTGAGKSLCYQLPALVEEGITVVVSPLISLMEDQVMALAKKGVSAKLMTSTSGKMETSAALEDLIDKKSTVKLLYVTPERFAKSKRFMAKLQKCFAEGRLQRIAIDEVHCCSQWGHDFRPDYKYLGVLSAMFPGIPILGLTATATTDVLVDVQKMLDIRGCLLIKSSFNRPNLFYQIIAKPSSLNECLDLTERLLKVRYKGQSGIIYATSIKDCSDLTEGLRKRGLKVACYHSNLEAAQRTSIHIKWTQKYYQAVVATVAFGLGIDKPDVRFVLHHSLSKSMESYYQESGRAGRDGDRAECVMMFRTQDIFRLSTMVFSSAGSLDHLYGMVRYCLDPFMCRRKIIAGHFDERWDRRDCNEMCDTCAFGENDCKEYSVEKYCRDIYKIITNASQNDTKLTSQKILDSWYGKGPVNLRVSEVSVPSLSKIESEWVIAFLLAEGYLKEDFHYTAYTTISYLKLGSKSHIVQANKDFKIAMTLRKLNGIDANCLAPTKLPEKLESKSPEEFSDGERVNDKRKSDEKTGKNKKMKSCETALRNNADIITID